jgi:hypothetical protein
MVQERLFLVRARDLLLVRAGLQPQNLIQIHALVLVRHGSPVREAVNPG